MSFSLSRAAVGYLLVRSPMQREQSVWSQPDCALPLRLKPSLSLAVLDLTAAVSTQLCNPAAAKTLVRLGYATAAKTPA